MSGLLQRSCSTAGGRVCGSSLAVTASIVQNTEATYLVPTDNKRYLNKLSTVCVRGVLATTTPPQPTVAVSDYKCSHVFEFEAPKLWNSLLQLIMSADLWFVVNDFWKHIFIDDQFFNLSSIVLDSYSSHLTYTWKYVHWNICKIVCLTAHLHAITCLLKFNSGFIQTLKYFVTVCFKKLQIKLFLPHE